MNYEKGQLMAACVNGFTGDYRIVEIETVEGGHYGFGRWGDGPMRAVYLDFRDCVHVNDPPWQKGDELSDDEFNSLGGNNFKSHRL